MGADVGLQLSYPVASTINETQGAPSWVESGSKVVGSQQGVTGLPYTTNDWMTTPTFTLGETLPVGWSFESPARGGHGSYDYGGGTTYSSTNGISVQVGLSASWSGVSVSTQVYVYSNVTVTTTSTMNIVDCSLGWAADPSGNDGVPYFWIYKGDPQSAVDHIWLGGWCGGNNEGSCTA